MKPRSMFLSFFLVAGIAFTAVGAVLAFSGDTAGLVAGRTFLMIGVIWVAVALGVRALYSGMGRRAEAEQRLFETGTRAPAVVEAVETTGMVFNRVNQQIVLGLRVQPKDGAEFTYRRRMLVPFHGMPRTGDLIEVAFDPGDRTKVALQTDWRSRTAGGRLLVTRRPGESPLAAGTQSASRPDPATLSNTPPPAEGDAGPEQVIAQLERLNRLKREGVLTETEFEAQKAKVLSGQSV